MLIRCLMSVSTFPTFICQVYENTELGTNKVCLTYCVDTHSVPQAQLGQLRWPNWAHGIFFTFSSKINPFVSCLLLLIIAFYTQMNTRLHLWWIIENPKTELLQGLNKAVWCGLNWLGSSCHQLCNNNKFTAGFCTSTVTLDSFLKCTAFKNKDIN